MSLTLSWLHCNSFLPVLSAVAIHNEENSAAFYHPLCFDLKCFSITIISALAETCHLLSDADDLLCLYLSQLLVYLQDYLSFMPVQPPYTTPSFSSSYSVCSINPSVPPSPALSERSSLIVQKAADKADALLSTVTLIETASIARRRNLEFDEVFFPPCFPLDAAPDDQGAMIDSESHLCVCRVCTRRSPASGNELRSSPPEQRNRLISNSL